MNDMEEKLAREMARMRIEDERRKRELNKICSESDELKELQNKIKAAYLNKERAQQMTESQFRKQVEIEEDAQIDMTMLKNKEIGDVRQREENERKLKSLQQNKREIQKQIEENDRLREEAYQEYMKEKGQVDAVVNRMIEEDNEQSRLNMQKKEQSIADMQLSMNEKRALLKRQKDMEEYEDEMVRRYAQQQQAREDEIKAMKAEAEAVKDQIFQKLAAEEEQRRAAAQFQEDLRNELYVQETEEAAQAKERAEAEKRVRVRMELQAAKDFQQKLKEERAAEERRMEDEFKVKLMEKFAEDERLEQMNAQRRRMREQEHKREVERLWQEKLIVFQQAREAELQEAERQRQEKEAQAAVVQSEKERLLAEHAAILQLHNPKAASQYGFQR